MAQILIEYDARNSAARKIMDFTLSFKYFKVKEINDECPYDKEFMKKIEQGRQDYKEGKCKVIDVDDLWK